ncbi:D-dopachrome decarboxylase-A-like [Aphelenchoides besseyi]|nr:D-dopachrome decarboxylase-A-like [Aphelenchoides besseyi]
MPILHVSTNLTDDQITNDFIQRAFEKVVELTGRPKIAVQVVVNANQKICFAGSFEPSAFVHLYEIIEYTDDQSRKTAQSLNKFLADELKINGERIFIIFNSKSPNSVVRDGQLIGDMLAKMQIAENKS